MSQLSVDRDELKASLARIATPKAMVTKIWEGKKFGKSSVKVVCVDSEKLDTLRFSDAWVGNDDDVRVGETHSVAINTIKEVTSVPEAKILVIEGVLQIHCESAEELAAWVTGLSVLRKVCEIETKQNTTATESSETQEESNEKTSSLNQKTRADLHSMFSYDNLPPGESRYTSACPEDPEAQNIEYDKDQIIDELSTQLTETNKALVEKEETIKNLSARLEHSLKMVKSVHAMYEQQSKVVTAQDAVIKEMDGANQAIQNAAGQMKSLLTKTPTKSRTPTGGQRSAPTTPGLGRGQLTREEALRDLQERNKNVTLNQVGKEENILTGLTQKSGLGVSEAEQFLQQELAKLKGMTGSILGGNQPKIVQPAQNKSSSQTVQPAQNKSSSQQGLTALLSSMSEEKSSFNPPPRDNQPSSDLSEDLAQAENLMGKIYDMKNLLDNLSKGSVDAKTASDLATTLRNGLVTSKPEKVTEKVPTPVSRTSRIQTELSQTLDPNQKMDPEALLGALASDPKLSSYLDNLTALETEKQSMESQLADAQNQQAAMLKKLEDMKSMVAMFNGMAKGN